MGKDTKVAEKNFRGLNNVTDPLRLDMTWQRTADNIDITDHAQIVRATGYTKRTTNTAISGAYATLDLQRMYVVDNGSLLEVFPDLSTTVLKTGLATATMYFGEVNGDVYYTNGTDFGVIEPSGVRHWGIAPPATPQLSYSAGPLFAGTYQVVCTLVDDRGMESGNSVPAVIAVPDDSQIDISGIPQVSGYTTNVYATAKDGDVYMLLAEDAGTDVTYNCGQDELGRELPFWNQNAPRGILPTLFEGQLYLAELFPAQGFTIIWRSLPLHYHHFDPGSEGIVVPGLVRVMAAITETKFAATERMTQRGTAEAIIIGTDRQVFSWSGGSGFKSPENQLVLLANYGVVPGRHAVPFGGHVYFWTLRGLCRALPFENLTQETFSVAPGVLAGGAIVEKDGIHRYVVALQKGGVPFNAHS